MANKLFITLIVGGGIVVLMTGFTLGICAVHWGVKARRKAKKRVTNSVFIDV